MIPTLTIIKSEINSEIGDKIDGVTVYDRVNVMANVRGNRLYVRENEGNAEKVPRKCRVSDQKSSQKSSQKSGQKSGQKNGKVTVNEGVNEGVKLSDKEKNIFELLKQNPAITTIMLIQTTGLSRSTVERAIVKLKSLNYIRRIGSDKGGHWEVVEK